MPDRIRIYYRPVSQDLVDGSMFAGSVVAGVVGSIGSDWSRGERFHAATSSEGDKCSGECQVPAPVHIAAVVSLLYQSSAQLGIIGTRTPTLNPLAS